LSFPEVGTRSQEVAVDRKKWGFEARWRRSYAPFGKKKISAEKNRDVGDLEIKGEARTPEEVEVT
jgi:hypothetical protein